jgi:hypothetical protein
MFKHGSGAEELPMREIEKTSLRCISLNGKYI